MAKVMKFADKVNKIKRSSMVGFPTDDGEIIEFKVESRSDKMIASIDAKYESRKPKVPTRPVPTANGRRKIIEDKDDPKYKEALAENSKRHFAELALAFLSEEERPEGEKEEQIDQILEVELAGFTTKIVQRGLEISGLIEEGELDEEVEAAKND